MHAKTFFDMLTFHLCDKLKETIDRVKLDFHSGGRTRFHFLPLIIFSSPFQVIMSNIKVIDEICLEIIQ